MSGPKSLGEALPAEMARVRDHIMPAYIEIGPPGRFALAAHAPPTPGTEVWQRGPVPGFAAELQPVVHALMQVIEYPELEILAIRPKLQVGG